jgi:two-component system, sensor histidine kinase YesM
VKTKKSVQASIFRSYLILILAAVAIFCSFFYFYTARILRDRAVAALSDSSLSLARSIDAEISKMNNISLNVSGSELLKLLFAERSEFPQSSDSSGMKLERYLRARRISDIVVTIIGPLKPVPQVYLYGLDGTAIGAGIASGEMRRSLDSMEWLPDLDLRSGAKIISPPRKDELLESTFPLYRERSYISLCRAFYDGSKKLLGVVEIKQFYDEVFKDLTERKEFIAVLDQENRQIFPFPSDRVASWSSSLALKAGGPASILSPLGSGRATAVSRDCRQIGWRVVVARRDAELMRPVTEFALLSAFAGLAILAASTFVASRLARQITTPIGNIRAAISRLDWDGLLTEGQIPSASGLDELEELEAAFVEMHDKLRESMSEALAARTHELRATMLALQSQMDPHFVYNMLATIGIMADRKMYDGIREAIGNMTHLLRYITSGTSSYVDLAEEVEYARRYLACMKARFQEGLLYSIELPERLAKITVPKLTIQPLVENCMKYGIECEPPWRISIIGAEGEGTWTIAVEDSGPGFSEEAFCSLRERLAPSADSAFLAESIEGGEGIGGLGLRNIAARLRLFYGEDAIFEIENPDSGGARVTIGGRYG